MLNNKRQLRSVSQTLLQPQQNQPGATVLFASTLHIVREAISSLWAKPGRKQ